jgi:hypothetical protein
MAYTQPTVRATGYKVLAADWNVFVNNELQRWTSTGFAWSGQDMSVANGYGLIVGNASQVAMGGVTPEAQVLGTSTADGSIGILQASNDAVGPIIHFAKDRATDIGTTFTRVSDNDNAGGLEWNPGDSADYATVAAKFFAEVDDGSPADGDIGMAFVWQSMAGGTASIAERMRLNAAGQLSITAGTASLPSLTTAGDLNTGFWFSTADTINASVGGAEVLELDAAALTITVPLSGAAITGTTIDATTDFTVGTTVITDDTITFGAAGSIDYSGNLYFTGTLATASNTNNYMVRFNEADSSVTASAANSGTGTSGYGFVVIDGEAIAAGSPLVFAESSSLMITGPPTQGTNMTLTKAFALNVVAGDVSMAATAKLFFDGGSHSYIYEAASDKVSIVVGNVNLVNFDESAGNTTFNPGNNNIDIVMRSSSGIGWRFDAGDDDLYLLRGDLDLGDDQQIRLGDDDDGLIDWNGSAIAISGETHLQDDLETYDHHTLSGGAATSAGVHGSVSRFVNKQGISDVTATSFATISFGSDAGQEGGGYTVFVRGNIGHRLLSNGGGGAVKGFFATYSGYRAGASGSKTLSAVTEIYESAETGSSVGVRGIDAVTLTVVDTDDDTDTLQINIDCSGTSASNTGAIAVVIEVVYDELRTRPTIAAV